MNHLLKQSCLQRILACVNSKYIGWAQNLPSAISAWSLKLICTIKQFWSLISVSSLPKLIKSWLVIDWHIIYILTQITKGFCSSILKNKIRTHICFASVTSERSVFSKVNHWNVLYLICVIILVKLWQRLNCKTKRNASWSLHCLVLRCIYNCCSHIFRRTLSIINTNERNASRGRTF